MNGVRTERLPTSFGLRFSGIDLGAPPSPAIVNLLKEALAEHHLLVLSSERPYNAADQVRWTREFGAPETYPSNLPHQLKGLPEVLRLTNIPGRGYLNSAEFWHQDGSFREFPTYLSFFNMVVRPEDGDATVFTNTHTAYERLPGHLLRIVDTAAATQNNGCRHAQRRTHPLTGRAGLFINVGYTGAVDGLRKQETAEYLSEMDGYLDGCESYSHRWQEGDLLIADNASLAHRASPDPVTGERTLLRTCVEGTMTF